MSNEEELKKEEKRIETINAGRRAQFLWDDMESMLVQQQEDLVKQIIQNFQLSPPDLNQKLLTSAAGLVALAKQGQQLKAAIMKGRKAWEEQNADSDDGTKNGTAGSA
jgi:hypothetical protein